MNDIFWIAQHPAAKPGARPVQLAILLRPRGRELLRGELMRIQQAGIKVLVSLMEWKEAVAFGLADEGAIAEELGMLFMPYPIPDHSLPPDLPSFRSFVDDLAVRLRAGRPVGIHCQGSIGRATITAACALIHLGWQPIDAIAAISEARGCQVPDTQEQENWILHYKASL